MGDADEAAPTGVTRTELGAAIPETEAHTAWALDPDGEEPPPRWTPRRITTAALGATLAIIGGAGIVALVGLREPASTPNPAPSVPTSPAPTAAALPPIRVPDPPPTSAPPPPPAATATVTVTAPEPTTRASVPPPESGFTAEQVAVYDRRFIANLRATNWVIWDETSIARSAHRVCAQLSNGATPWAVQQEMVNAGRSLSEAQSFVVTAMMVYPGCP